MPEVQRYEPLILPQPERGTPNWEHWASQVIVELTNWSERLGARVIDMIAPEEFDAVDEVARGAADTALQRYRDSLLALAADPAERAKVINPVLRSLRDDVQLMYETVAQLQANYQRLAGATADAGLIIDAPGGKAEIYAFRQVNDRFSSVQVTLDSLAAQIALIATTASGDLSGLLNSITTVQVRLDAVEASLVNYVLHATFDPVSARITTAEVRLDGLDAAITARVTHAEFDPVETRISNVELTLQAFTGGSAGGIIEQTILGLIAKSPEIQVTYNSLGDILNHLMNVRTEYSEFAFARDRLVANTDEMGATVARNSTELVALRGETIAEVARLDAAIVDGDVAIALIAQSAVAAAADTEASLQDEIILRADGDSALGTRATSLEATVFSGTIGNVAVNARIATEESVRASVDTSLASRATTLEATTFDSVIGNSVVNTRIATEESVRASVDTSLASRATTLESTVFSGTMGNSVVLARLVQEETTRADDDEALAEQFTELSTTVGGHTSTLAVQSGSINGILVRHGVIGVINGVTGGYIFQGVLQLDGTVAYTIEFNAAVIFNGALVINGTVDTPKLALNSVSNSAASTGFINSGAVISVSMTVRGDHRVLVTFDVTPENNVGLSSEAETLNPTINEYQIQLDGSQVDAFHIWDCLSSVRKVGTGVYVFRTGMQGGSFSKIFTGLSAGSHTFGLRNGSGFRVHMAISVTELVR